MKKILGKFSRSISLLSSIALLSLNSHAEARGSYTCSVDITHSHCTFFAKAKPNR